MRSVVRIRLTRAMGALIIATCVAERPTDAGQAPGRRQDIDALRIAAATQVVSAVTSSEKSIPRAVLAKAEGIAAFPVMPRLPDRSGQGPNTRRTARMMAVDARGVLSVRGSGGTWSTPAFINVTGESVPEDADLVLVIASKRALDSLMKPEFALDANIAIAPGPTSADPQAWTDAQRRAEIFAYARTGGALDGAALAGSRVQADTIANQRFYGTQQLLTTTAAVARADGPESIAPWRETLQKQVSPR
jgi:lipid-binding SYLF domain-containing protein